MGNRVNYLGLYVLFLLLITSCSKSGEGSPVLPPSEPSLIEWIWETEIDGWVEKSFGTEVHNDPMLYDNKIIITSRSNVEFAEHLYILDGEKGSLEFEGNIQGSLRNKFNSSTIIGDKLLLNSWEGIKAVNIEEKTLAWEQPFQREEDESFQISSFGNTFYNVNYLETGSTSHPYYGACGINAYDASTGRKERVVQDERIDELYSPLNTAPLVEAVGGDTILTYATQYHTWVQDGLKPRLVRYNQTQDSLIWEVEEFSEGLVEFAPLSYNGQLIIAADWSIYSFDPETGELNWRTEYAEEFNNVSGFLETKPLIYNNHVFIINRLGVLICLDATTGNKKYTNVVRKDGPFSVGPAPLANQDLLINEGILFVNSSSSSDMILFDIETGKEIDRYEDDRYSGQNIIYNEELDLYYVTTLSKGDQPGKVKAFRLKK